MIFPPIFSAANVTAVRALLGVPVRFWMFSRAPQPGAPNYAKPYAVWQTITGSPENYINQLPDTDSFTAQVDVYGDTGDSVTNVATALRDALEPVAYVTAWRGETKDPNTNLFRFSFDVDFFTNR